MKKAIDLWAHAGEILETVGKGVLLTTKVGDRVNTMTIGWGTLGIEWKTPIFTAFVRESRLTREFLDKNPEFTVNIPVVGDVKEILGVCGTHSGRDMDKIAQLGLHLEEPEHISVPGIRELPLTLECKVIYRQDQDLAAITPENIRRFYPPVPPQEQGDHHIAYYGQILGAYLIED